MNFFSEKGSQLTNKICLKLKDPSNSKARRAGLPNSRPSWVQYKRQYETFPHLSILFLFYFSKRRIITLRRHFAYLAMPNPQEQHLNLHHGFGASYWRSTVVDLVKFASRATCLVLLYTPGLLGRPICEVLVVSIATTSDMAGLSSGDS